MNPLLSLCMIVRDEERCLGQAIESALPLVDEVVVVDTGSQDSTPEIARSLGAAVYHIPWENDFSKARNASLDRARGKWALILDADEVLDVSNADLASIRATLASDDGPDGFLVRVVCPYSAEEGRTISHTEEFSSVRLFRNDGTIRYHYPVHNQLDLEGRNLAPLPLRIDHHGYMDKEILKRKQARTWRLLDAMDESHPYRIYHTIRLLSSQGCFEEIPPLLEKLKAHSQGRLPISVPEVSYLTVLAHLNMGQYEQAECLLDEALRACPGHVDLSFASLFLAVVRYIESLMRTLESRHWLFRQAGAQPATPAKGLSQSKPYNCPTKRSEKRRGARRAPWSGRPPEKGARRAPLRVLPNYV